MSNDTAIWSNFVYRIIMQAIYDLEKAIREDDEETIKEVESFFRSTLYEAICTIDAEKLIELTKHKAKYTR